MLIFYVLEYSHVGFYCLTISCFKYNKPTYAHNLGEIFMLFVAFLLIGLSSLGDPQLELHGVLYLFNIGCVH